MPDPLRIRVPPGTAETWLPAWFLATLGCPPQHGQDVAWQQTAAAFRHEIALALTADDARPPLDLAALDLRLPDALRQHRLARAMDAIERALAAAHAAMPFIVRSHHQAQGLSLGTAPGAYRRPLPRTLQADRTMRWEAELLAQRQRHGLPPVPPRMPGIGSTSAEKNFLSRVAAPSRPVLHLAAALAQVLDVAERRVAAEYGSPDRWEAAGFGTIELPQADGSVACRPQVHLGQVLSVPALSLQAIHLARALLPATAAYLATGRSKAPVRLIDLDF